MSHLYVYQHNTLMAQPSLWQGIASVCTMQCQHTPQVISFVGAGGKTTWIYALAQEQRMLGKRVLIVTTTHMKRPMRWGVLTENRVDIARQLDSEGIAIAGIPCEDGKITYIGDTLFQAVSPLADIILIEADGSKRVSLKALGRHEPVIVPQTQYILCLAGMSSVGKPIGKGCFRWQELSVRPQDILTPAVFSKVWRRGCLDILRKRYTQPVIPILNQCDTKELQEQAQYILQQSGTAQGLISSFSEQEREQQ